MNGALVYEQIERLGLSRVTVDMDGTVVQAGNQVAWAFRGFNPHRKKSKSYYPLFAHLAQTGQILKSRNRPGNVHDSRGADAFLRELIGELQGRFGRSRKLEFRMDAAFFNEKILKRLERSRCELVLPLLSVGEMTLRLYGAFNYSQNSARDLRCALNGA